MIEMTIQGMSCDNCVRHVTEALQAVAGVSQVRVQLDSGTARLEAAADPGDEALKAAVEEEGYDVTAITRG